GEGDWRRIWLCESRVPAGQQARVVSLRARWVDAPVYARSLRREWKAEAADRGEMGNYRGGSFRGRSNVLRHHHRSPSRRATVVLVLGRWWSADEDHIDGWVEPGTRLPRQYDARSDLLLQQQAAGSVHHAEQTRLTGTADQDR